MHDTESGALYKAWFDSIPQMFRAMMPRDGARMFAPSVTPGAEERAHDAPAFPAAFIAQALDLTQALLTQLYQAYLPMLAQGGLSVDAMNGLARAASDAHERLLALTASAAAMADADALSPMTGIAPWQTLMGAGGDAVHPHGDARKLLQLGVERTFGGLADALGLGGWRELDEAMREMSAAHFERQRAHLEYLALWTEAWNEGTNALVGELAAKASRGERVESLLALIRLWARSVDGAVHRLMQSERGLGITARAIRAATMHREHFQKAVALVSDALHLPTRAEVDDAYREIQALKREVRQLRRSLAGSGQGASPDAAARAPGKGSRKRATTAAARGARSGSGA